MLCSTYAKPLSYAAARHSVARRQGGARPDRPTDRSDALSHRWLGPDRQFGRSGCPTDPADADPLRPAALSGRLFAAERPDHPGRFAYRATFCHFHNELASAQNPIVAPSALWDSCRSRPNPDASFGTKVSTSEYRATIKIRKIKSRWHIYILQRKGTPPTARSVTDRQPQQQRRRHCPSSRLPDLARHAGRLPPIA